MTRREPGLLERFEGFLEAGGMHRLLEGFRDFATMVMLLEPETDWVLKREENDPLWFLVDPLLHEWDYHRCRQLLMLTMKDERRLVAVVTDVLYARGGLQSVQAAFPRGDAARRYPDRHLAHGLEHLARGEAFEAWPPIIIGLEGQIRAFAEDRGVIDRSGKVLPPYQPAGKQRGIEAILGYLEIPAYFKRFVKERVYGGSGHPFRHGFAQGDVEQQMIYAAVAVAGWLDHINVTEPLAKIQSEFAASPLLAAALEAQKPVIEEFIEERTIRWFRDLEPSRRDFILPAIERLANDPHSGGSDNQP